MRMNKIHRIGLQERRAIKELLLKDPFLTFSEIGRRLNIHRKSISAELKRFNSVDLYDPEEADRMIYEERSKSRRARTTLKHFTIHERIFIEKSLKKGDSVRKISLNLERSHSGVNSEIKRGGGIHNYSAELGEKTYLENMKYTKTMNNKELELKLQSLEMQIEILVDQIRSLTNKEKQ